MLKNYLKLAFRNLTKHKLVTFINVFGLSAAVGVSIFVFSILNFEFNTDSFHKKKEKIFLVLNVVQRDGIDQVWGDSPAPIGPMLVEDFPQVQRMTRVLNKDLVFKFQDKVFYEYGRFVDPDFMEMFTFPLKYGTKESLRDPSKIIISQDLANKYFDRENPVGKQVVLDFGLGNASSFIIGGVAEKFPGTASFSFPILINWQNKATLFPKESDNDWTDFITATFIELDSPGDREAVEGGMDKYVQIQNQLEEDWPAKAYTLQDLAELSLNTHQIEGSLSRGEEPSVRITLSILAIFLIVLASFNYMNIAIASASKRLNEIALRKAIGSNKSQLVAQFLIENVLLTTIALIFGLLLGKYVIVPYFDQIFSIGMSLDLMGSMDVWLFCLGLLLLLALVSGTYPAIYIASFKPVDIFRGKFKLSGSGKFSNSLLLFQFTLSILAIITGIIFVQNVDYQESRDWGYTKDQTFVMQAPDPESFKILRDKVAQLPSVKSVIGAKNHLGVSLELAVLDKNGEKFEAQLMNVGANYLDVMGIQLLEGRNFLPDKTSDHQSVIVNETFVQQIGWDQIIDNTFTMDSVEHTVIGVVRDYHYVSFWSKIRPAMLRMAPEENYVYLISRIEGGSINQTKAEFEAIWKQNLPDYPFNGFFQDQVFEDYFNNIKGHSKLLGFIASLAIVLSSMGLFGLVSLNVEARRKDFSIKKVLGANTMEMAKGVNQQFIWILIIASIIGAPLSYFVVHSFLETIYEYHVPVSITSIVAGITLIFIIAFLTVSSLLVKVIRENPVDSLRSE